MAHDQTSVERRISPETLRFGAHVPSKYAALRCSRFERTAPFYETLNVCLKYERHTGCGF
jgi:hypothetical protein